MTKISMFNFSLSHNLLLSVFLLIISTGSAQALPSILSDWQDRYPNSNSDELQCQLCHQSGFGGDPWNAYGATLRNILRQTGDLQEAFDIAEDVNNDNDPSGGTNLDEINNDYQPGWTVGNNNTIFTVDSTDPSDDTLIGTANQPPPVFALNSTRLDPAVPSQNTVPDVNNGTISVNLETVASGFTSPVMAARAPGLDGLLFVVQLNGEISQVDLSNGSKTLFHDVNTNSTVSLLFGGERGLLGLAVDPNYTSNGYFYTYQSESVNGAADFSTLDTPNHQTVISEWRTNNPSDPTNFSISSVRRVILRIDQPQANHNGGMLNFGPDGLLYISTGDGGSANDQGAGHGIDGNGRNNQNPLGAILRINPRGSNSNNARYGIPNDNPFVGTNGLDEIYAFGFRNPYRFTFDRQCFNSNQSCNTLMLGDVGQGEIEEVDNVVAGGNYGWNWKEGSFFFYSPVESFYNNIRYISTDSPPNIPNDLIDPVAEYRNGSQDGRSAVGGYIYRGDQIPALAGRYVFADFFNRLYYLDGASRVRRFSLPQTPNIGGFGEDDENELYVVTQAGANGLLQKIVAAGAEPNDEPSDELCVPIRTVSGSVALICL